MKIRLYVTILFFIPSFVFANTDTLNYIPNCSFDKIKKCVIEDVEFNYLYDWIIPNVSSPDYFLRCRNGIGGYSIPFNIDLGYQESYDNDGYIGLYVYSNTMKNSVKNYREYIEVKLKDTLTVGIKYKVSAYFSLADTSIYAVTPISFGFTKYVYKHDESPHPNIPIDSLYGYIDIVDNFITDKTNWVKCEKIYVAKGGESYMIIGNFRKDCESKTLKTLKTGTKNKKILSYYFIDNISIVRQ